MMNSRDEKKFDPEKNTIFTSGVPSQNSRPHACMVCMVIPPKRGLEYLEVQILEYLIPGL